MNKKDGSLAIEQLSFAFQEGKPFFENLSFSVEPRRLYFIQGKNGSGKSTLMRILQGNVTETEFLRGTIIFDGNRYNVKNNELDSAFTKEVKMVTQNVDTMLADEFTVQENLRFANLHHFPVLKGLPGFSFSTFVTEFNIGLNQPVHLLSGGQRQILAIIMALQKQTRILLLDEPTAALDPKNARMVLDCLKLLAQKTNLIVLIISHDHELIANYAPEGSFYMQEKKDGTRFIEFS